MILCLLQTDWTIFLGRFHPVLVHLPIGFLLFAGIMELVDRRSSRRDYGQAVSLGLLLGAVSGLLAASCGWMLAESGGYDPDNLFWHRWLGVSTVVLSGFGWLVKTDRLNWNRLPSSWMMVVLLALLTITGHLGGKLTHGENYLLAYAPGFIQSLAGLDSDDQSLRIAANPDSVFIYKDLIQPVFEQKCISCHNESKANGDLVLSTYAGLLDGGEHGVVIDTEHPLESELLRRVTIDPASSKFMPPKGSPLTYTEVQLISWWIKSGADSSLRLSDPALAAELKFLLKRDYGLDTRPKPYVEIASAPPIAAEASQQIEAAGFKLIPLAANSNFMEISLQAGTERPTSEQLRTLLSASPQITWLNLPDAGLSDEDLSTIGELSQLTRLRLQRNKLTDAGLKHLKHLQRLESLNLYGNQITDAGIVTLAALPALRKLYLWQTAVTQQGVERLQQLRPELDIDIGQQVALQLLETGETERGGD